MKIDLYEIGYIKDVRLYFTLQIDDYKNWFNIIHKNRFKGHNIGKNKKK